MSMLKGALDKLTGQVKANFSGKDFKFREADAYKFQGDGDSATAGGSLSKAKLVVVDDKCSFKNEEFVFQYNPNEVEITKKVSYASAMEGGYDVPQRQFSGGMRSMSFKEVVFDTAETRESVWVKYIQKFEKLVHLDEELHRPPHVMLVWGKFLENGQGGGGSSQVMDSFRCDVTELKVKYTMFLEDGTPVRARMTLTLEDAENKAEKKSPDYAKVYVVRRGDTLQHIAFREYDDPGEWRRIARTNGIDDPLRVKPGTRLLIPPILK